MKMVELTDVAMNKAVLINLDQVPAMESVPGPAGEMVTRLRFGDGDKMDVYETIDEIMLLAREPVRGPGLLH
jgi:hypothetical protein